MVGALLLSGSVLPAGRNQVVSVPFWPYCSGMARQATEGELRCSRDLRKIPKDMSAPGELCPNVAEYLLSFRDGAFPVWVCGRHVEWWGRRQKVIRRASLEYPPAATESVVMQWGTAEESEEAAKAWMARSRSEGRAVIQFGTMYLPDGTEMPFGE